MNNLNKAQRIGFNAYEKMQKVLYYKTVKKLGAKYGEKL